MTTREPRSAGTEPEAAHTGKPRHSSAKDALRHGAYVCLHPRRAGDRTLAGLPVGELAQDLELAPEYDARDGHPTAAIAFLRHATALAGEIEDEPLRRAEAVVHVAAPASRLVETFCAELCKLLEGTADLRILRGIVRPTVYTGNAMHGFAYARQVEQRPGPEMPNAFLLPLCKTQDWWDKDWMERHTFFLPRYDGDARMRAEGHALAAAPGIECLLRRTYKSPVLPAPAGQYDFVTYFECADEDLPTFHRVREALRDTSRNPEWEYVREGPLWHGRRVASWAELFD